jgi:hypothetical protein
MNLKQGLAPGKIVMVRVKDTLTGKKLVFPSIVISIAEGYDNTIICSIFTDKGIMHGQSIPDYSYGEDMNGWFWPPQ